MLKCKSIDSPMDVNTKLLPDQRELLEDAGRYRRLVGKLDSDQTGYHIRSLRCKIVFVSTKVYPLGGSNEVFEVSEESSKKRTSLFRS